jgi:hypothetical protein
MGGRRFCVLVVAVAALAAACARETSEPPRPPDFSGTWAAGRGVQPDAARVAALPPETVVLGDAGAPEFPAGDFGGLRPKPAALEAAKTWDPRNDMSIDRVCVPPSIVYSMQGPFPLEIHQGADMLVIRLEYYDLARVIFLDGRPHPPADAPHTKVGHSVGRWDGSALVVETTHLSSSTITNNGLDHGENVRFLERFWLSDDGNTLFAVQEFEDPDVLENRGARFMAWARAPGQYIFPYECDPSFSLNYQK